MLALDDQLIVFQVIINSVVLSFWGKNSIRSIAVCSRYTQDKCVFILN